MPAFTFPSLGFPKEYSGGERYYRCYPRPHLMITVWLYEDGVFEVRQYKEHIFNGVSSWGGRSEEFWRAPDLLSVIAIIHHLTLEGNEHEAVH